MWSNCG